MRSFAAIGQTGCLAHALHQQSTGPRRRLPASGQRFQAPDQLGRVGVGPGHAEIFNRVVEDVFEADKGGEGVDDRPHDA